MIIVGYPMTDESIKVEGEVFWATGEEYNVRADTPTRQYPQRGKKRYRAKVANFHVREFRHESKPLKIWFDYKKRAYIGTEPTSRELEKSRGDSTRLELFPDAVDDLSPAIAQLVLLAA